jgi:hypothetical protein
MGAIMRGAQAQEESRALIEAHEAITARLKATLAELHQLRDERARGSAQQPRRAAAGRGGG